MGGSSLWILVSRCSVRHMVWYRWWVLRNVPGISERMTVRADMLAMSLSIRTHIFQVMPSTLCLVVFSCMAFEQVLCLFDMYRRGLAELPLITVQSTPSNTSASECKTSFSLDCVRVMSSCSDVVLASGVSRSCLCSRAEMSDLGLRSVPHRD